MPIYRLGAAAPNIPDSAWIAPEATLIGNVRLGARVTVWPAAVIRGDDDLITIGDDSNVQDGAVLHVDPGVPLTLGARVSVGHQAMIHGCTVGDGSLIGIQALVMNHAVIGRDCLVAAGALVTERKTFPDRTLIVGAPARALRDLTDAEVAGLRAISERYVRRGARYRSELKRVDARPSPA